LIFVLLARLSVATASWAKCSCSVPSGATGPVIGPSNPTDATHDLVLAAPPVDPPPAALLLLLLLQPATASEPTAAMARTRRPFMGYASIPGLSHNVRGRNLAALSRADGRNAPGSAACGILRRSAPTAQTQYALPNGRIRNADQTIAVCAKARGLMWYRPGSCEVDIKWGGVPRGGSVRWLTCSVPRWTSRPSGPGSPRCGRVSPSTTRPAARRSRTR